MSKVYVGPASPTSWPAGPLMPVRSSNAKVTGNGDDPSHAHRFVPPFSVVVGCPENTTKNMPHDGFHRVTACRHTFMEERMPALWYHPRRRCVRGPARCRRGHRGRVCHCHQRACHRLVPVRSVETRRWQPGTDWRLHSCSCDDDRNDFTVKGDMPGFQRLKLTAHDPTQRERCDLIMQAGDRDR